MVVLGGWLCPAGAVGAYAARGCLRRRRVHRPDQVDPRSVPPPPDEIHHPRPPPLAHISNSWRPWDWSPRGYRLRVVELNCLFNVTINDISVIYVTAHRCAGGLKKYDLRSGSQCHRHFVGFCNVPVLAPTRDQPFYTVIPTHRPI